MLTFHGMSFALTHFFDDDIFPQIFADDHFGITDLAQKRAGIRDLLNDRRFAKPHFPQTLAYAVFSAQALHTHLMPRLDLAQGFQLSLTDAFLFLGKYFFKPTRCLHSSIPSRKK